MMSDSFELNDLLLDIFPELEFYINQMDLDYESNEESDEVMAALHEVTVDYYQQEFKL
jgi:hypothetical protein